MISFHLQCCQDCRVIVDVSESYPRRDAAMSHTVFEDRSLCSCISSVFLISFSGIISASRFRSFTVHECHRCQWKPLSLTSFVYSVLILLFQRSFPVLCPENHCCYFLVLIINASFYVPILHAVSIAHEFFLTRDAMLARYRPMR